MSGCTKACWAMPDCTKCGKRKAPRGRSIPLPAANGYCDSSCVGYYREPKAGHLWPGEEPEPVSGSTGSKEEP